MNFFDYVKTEDVAAMMEELAPLSNREQEWVADLLSERYYNRNEDIRIYGKEVQHERDTFEVEVVDVDKLIGFLNEAKAKSKNLFISFGFEERDYSDSEYFIDFTRTGDLNEFSKNKVDQLIRNIKRNRESAKEAEKAKKLEEKRKKDMKKVCEDFQNKKLTFDEFNAKVEELKK